MDKYDALLGTAGTDQAKLQQLAGNLRGEGQAGQFFGMSTIPQIAQMGRQANRDSQLAAARGGQNFRLATSAEENKRRWDAQQQARQQAQKSPLNFQNAILFHSGGWKKLYQQAVDNKAFKQACAETIGRVEVRNFYGMVEQTGTIYIECEQGYLHTPVYSDILIRDPNTLKVLPNGEQGLIQLLSVLPYSYPGQSILTEDLGTIIGTDNCSCGRKGHYFQVSGRLSKSEARGCSDTYQ